MTTFSTEADFERAVVRELTQRGWESAILKNPSEKDLIENWARILLENNRGIDRLNDIPPHRGGNAANHGADHRTAYPTQVK